MSKSIQKKCNTNPKFHIMKTPYKRTQEQTKNENFELSRFQPSQKLILLQYENPTRTNPPPKNLAQKNAISLSFRQKQKNPLKKWLFGDSTPHHFTESHTNDDVAPSTKHIWHLWVSGHQIAKF